MYPSPALVNVLQLALGVMKLTVTGCPAISQPKISYLLQKFPT